MTEWTLVGKQPHVRQDGTSMFLEIWERPCAACGVPFRVSTPPNRPDSWSFRRIHCPDHKLTPAEAGARGVAVRAETRARRLTEYAHKHELFMRELREIEELLR